MDSKLWKKIVREKQKEVRALKKRFTLEAIRTASFSVGTEFVSAQMSLLDAEYLPVILPLQGRILELDTELSNYRPFRAARSFREWPVAAFLVAGDATFLGGDPAHVNLVKNATGASVILHDFVVDEVQIYQAKAIGADGLLLDANWQEREQLKRFTEVTYEVGLEPFIRIHSPHLPNGIEPGWIGGVILSPELTVQEIVSGKLQPLYHLVDENVPILYQTIPETGESLLALQQTGVQGFLIPENWVLENDPFEKLIRQFELLWPERRKGNPED